LLREKKLYPEQIVLYGRSLGSGPSCHLAAKAAAMGRPVAGLILHSPFTSVYRVVFDFGFTVVGDKFSNIDVVGKTQCPVFIVHGQDDEIVPVIHGK
jgi:abhydrolase domain-containing protein 17